MATYIINEAQEALCEAYDNNFYDSYLLRAHPEITFRAA